MAIFFAWDLFRVHGCSHGNRTIMANPIQFVPKAIDPKLELQRRLTAAPMEHAEALLVAFDVLEEAHRQGVLDAIHGAIGAKDTIVASLAAYSAEPMAVHVVRNLLALGKIVGTLEPEPLSRVSKAMVAAAEEHRAEKEPPSLWQLFKRMRTPHARRGLSFMTRMLSAIGGATKHNEAG
jgi:uncharacterized protein YjgD (DUF1641 family)